MGIFQRKAQSGSERAERVIRVRRGRRTAVEAHPPRPPSPRALGSVGPREEVPDELTEQSLAPLEAEKVRVIADEAVAQLKGLGEEHLRVVPEVVEVLVVLLAQRVGLRWCPPEQKGVPRASKESLSLTWLQSTGDRDVVTRAGAEVLRRVVHVDRARRMPGSEAGFAARADSSVGPLRGIGSSAEPKTGDGVHREVDVGKREPHAVAKSPFA